MCLPLVGRVLTVDGDRVEIELLGGGSGAHAVVNRALWPDVGPDEHVLVDRGLVIKVIDAAEAETILGFYAELEGAWDELELVDA